jgi:hypothetical protein
MNRSYKFGNIFRYSYIHGDMGSPNEDIVYVNVEFLKDVGDDYKMGDVVEYLNFDCTYGKIWVINADGDPVEMPRKYVLWA